MYKVKNDLSPPFRKEIINCIGIGHKTRMGDKFNRPNINRVYEREHSLQSFGMILWDTMVPEKLQGCSSLAEFKNSKKWVPKHCPCSLCKNYVDGLGYTNVFE